MNFISHKPPWIVQIVEVDGLEWSLGHDGTWSANMPMDVFWNVVHERYQLDTDYDAPRNWFFGTTARSIPKKCYEALSFYYFEEELRRSLFT